MADTADKTAKHGDMVRIAAKLRGIPVVELHADASNMEGPGVTPCVGYLVGQGGLLAHLPADGRWAWDLTQHEASHTLHSPLLPEETAALEQALTNEGVPLSAYMLVEELVVDEARAKGNRGVALGDSFRVEDRRRRVERWDRGREDIRALSLSVLWSGPFNAEEVATLGLTPEEVAFLHDGAARVRAALYAPTRGRRPEYRRGVPPVSATARAAKVLMEWLRMEPPADDIPPPSAPSPAPASPPLDTPREPQNAPGGDSEPGEPEELEELEESGGSPGEDTETQREETQREESGEASAAERTPTPQTEPAPLSREERRRATNDALEGAAQRARSGERETARENPRIESRDRDGARYPLDSGPLNRAGARDGVGKAWGEHSGGSALQWTPLPLSERLAPPPIRVIPRTAGGGLAAGWVSRMVGGSARLFRSRVLETREVPVATLHVSLLAMDRRGVPRERIAALLRRAAERGAVVSVCAAEPLCYHSQENARPLLVSDGRLWVGASALERWVANAQSHSFGGTWAGVTRCDDLASGPGLRVLVTDGHEHCGADGGDVRGSPQGWGSWSLLAEVQRRKWLVACPARMASAFWARTPEGAVAQETWRTLHRVLGLPM